VEAKDWTPRNVLDVTGNWKLSMQGLKKLWHPGDGGAQVEVEVFGGGAMLSLTHQYLYSA
jgi:hypothetical protein